MPLISVIIPVYNASDTIVRCLESVSRQEEEDFECIVVDDKSTDDSREVVSAFLQSNADFARKVKVCDLEVNVGPSSARNVALKMVTGTYVTFVDADDYLEPNAFNMYVKAMNRYGYDVLYSDFYTERRFVRERTVIGKKYVDNVEAIKGMLINARLFDGALWNKCYRTSFLQKTGELFVEGSNAWEDLSLNVRLFAQTKKIGKLKGFYYHHYSYNPKSVVHKWEENEEKLLSKIQQEEMGLRVAEDDLKKTGIISKVEDALKIRKCGFKSELNGLSREKRQELWSTIFPEINDEYDRFLWKERWWRMYAMMDKLLAIARSVVCL